MGYVPPNMLLTFLMVITMCFTFNVDSILDSPTNEPFMQVRRFHSIRRATRDFS
jgi:hypothetical protein